MKSSYDLLKTAADRYPTSAIIFPDEGKRYSYAEFLAEVDICARALSGFGIGAGDRVAIYGQNSSYWMKCFFAILKTGAVAVPMNSKAVEDDILYMVKAAGVKMLFYLSEAQLSEKLAHSVPAIVTIDGIDSFLKTGLSLPDVDSVCGDLQLIMFTSGTSANPKGVMLGPECLMNSITDYKKTLGLGPDDVMLLNLPLSYCYGCVLICCSFCLAGASLVVSRSFAAGKTLRMVEKYHCTILNMVPTMYQLLFSSELMSRYDLSSVRAAVVGGSYTSQELVDRMRAVFGRNSVLCGYGMTECSSWALSQRFDDPVELRGTSVGWPVDNMEARIAPGYGEAENGMIQGELCLRGKAMMAGYLDAAVTAEAYDDEGWFHTGDVVRRDSDGRYWIVDRCKDMIIKGGENISPKRVELVLDSFDGIENAQVVGIQDAVYGEKVVAVISRSQADSIDMKALLSYLRQRLSKNRRPDFYVALKEIPMTANGKVNKQAIRNMVDGAMNSLKRNTINYL